VSYPFKLPGHARKTVAQNAVVQAAIYPHSSACGCGCAAPLANNRKVKDASGFKIDADLNPRGFADSLKVEVNRSTEAREDKYASNMDTMAFALRKTPSIILDSYVLSNIVAQVEANTDFFPKKTDKSVAGNCGKRVMPKKLRQKIFGLSAADIEGVDSAVDIVSCEGSVSYTNVMCCHNVWGCPVCARKISERRKKGLSLLLTSHFDRFGADSVAGVLFTIPHALGDDAKDTVLLLRKCRTDMTQMRGYKQLMKTMKNCGFSRALEVTYGTAAGFHPHFHLLNFFENSILADHEFLADTLFSLWSQALQKNGLKAPSRAAFGCTIIPSTKKGIDAVAEYFSKVESDVNDADIATYLKKHKTTVREVAGKTGWGIEHEMTKWHLKQGQGDGFNFRYSMFDLLRGYSITAANGDEESRKKFRALWLSYREAFKGQPQLYTRHKHFKIKELEMSEKELAEEEPEEETKIIYSIPFEIWLMVVFMGARGILLEKARTKGRDGVIDFLQGLGLLYEDFFPDNPLARKSKNLNPYAFYSRVTFRISYALSPRAQGWAIRKF